MKHLTVSELHDMAQQLRLLGAGMDTALLALDALHRPAWTGALLGEIDGLDVAYARALCQQLQENAATTHAFVLSVIAGREAQ